MANRIPNARLEVIENSRHYPFLEEPEKFFKILRAFIQSGG
jgi:pimeloyl-ACP methyl ester carboxylesterase